MHAGVITAGGIRLLTSKQKIYLVGVGWISEDVPLGSKLKKPQVRNVGYKNGFQATWNFPWIVSTFRL